MLKRQVQDHLEMSRSLRMIDLPPPFRLVMLREVGDAFAYTSAHAAELGAGTLVFVGGFHLAEFAVVLEPEAHLESARRIFYAGMAALADALSALAPPETPIAIEWPDRIKIGRGLVGGARLGWPQFADESARPDWLVFGAVVRLISRKSEAASLGPAWTALAEEGFDEVSAERVVAGFARHLMVMIDRWQEDDFASIAQSYLARLRSESLRRVIDASGNLRIVRAGNPVILSLRPALAAPSWLGHTSECTP